MFKEHLFLSPMLDNGTACVQPSGSSDETQTGADPPGFCVPNVNVSLKRDCKTTRLKGDSGVKMTLIRWQSSHLPIALANTEFAVRRQQGYRRVEDSGQVLPEVLAKTALQAPYPQS